MIDPRDRHVEGTIFLVRHRLQMHGLSPLTENHANVNQRNRALQI